MTVATDLYSTLTGDSGIAAVVGTRVYPVIDRGASVPSIVYNFQNNFPRATMGQQTTIRRMDLQLDFFTKTYADIDTIRQRFNAIFNSRTFALGNTNVTGSYISGSIETIDDDDDTTFRLITEVVIFA